MRINAEKARRYLRPGIDENLLLLCHSSFGCMYTRRTERFLLSFTSTSPSHVNTRLRSLISPCSSLLLLVFSFSSPSLLFSLSLSLLLLPFRLAAEIDVARLLPHWARACAMEECLARPFCRDDRGDLFSAVTISSSSSHLSSFLGEVLGSLPDFNQVVTRPGPSIQDTHRHHTSIQR